MAVIIAELEPFLALDIGSCGDSHEGDSRAPGGRSRLATNGPGGWRERAI